MMHFHDILPKYRRNLVFFFLTESFARDRQSTLILTKNVDVAGGHSATTRTKSMDLIQEKAYTNCENDL